MAVRVLFTIPESDQAIKSAGLAFIRVGLWLELGPDVE